MKHLKRIGIALLIVSHFAMWGYLYVVNHNIITAHEQSEMEHFVIWQQMCKKVSS